MTRTLGGLLIAVMSFGAGCYAEYAPPPRHVMVRPVTVAVPPPAPVDEVPPPEPYAGAIWMSSYWDWRPDLARYVWVAGHWTTPPRAGVAFVPPSYRPSPYGGYERLPGHWINAPTRDAYGRHIAYDSLGRPHYF